MSKFVSVVMLSLCVSGSVFADALRIFAVDEPPSSFVTEQGEPAGFAVDVVRAIQQKIGNNDPIQFVPEVRALKIAEDSPNVVLFGFSRTEAREDQFHWVTLLTRKSWVLYAHKDSDIKLSSLDDARGIDSIGVVRGDVRAAHLKNLGFTNIEEVAYHDLNVKMLINNRINLLYYEPLGMAYACQKLGIDPDEFQQVLKTRVSEVYVLMSKNGTDPALAAKWQAASEALKREGTFQRIAEKWSAVIQQQTGIRSNVEEGALNF